MQLEATYPPLFAAGRIPGRPALHAMGAAVCLIFTTLSARQDSLVEKTVGSNYTLGRILGGHAVRNISVFGFHEEGFVSADLYNSSVGSADRFRLGWSGLGIFGSSGSYGLLCTMLPEFDLSLKMGRSHRADVVLLPANLFLLAAPSGPGTGFEVPFYMQNHYHWSFLSREARIRIPEDQFDYAFYFEPLLNAGQVGFTIDVNHTMKERNSSLPALFDARSVFRIGIRNNLQISARGLLRTQRSKSPTGYGVRTDDTSSVAGRFTFRSGSVFSAGHYGLSSSDPLYPVHRHSFSLETGYLHGRSVGTVSAIRGNWDGFFSPVLGLRQLFAGIGFARHFIPEESDEGGDTTYMAILDYRREMTPDNSTLKNRLTYGLTERLTLGETFRTRFGRSLIPRHYLVLDAAFMNVPRRDYGPSSASRFEYLFGYLPRDGQIVLQATIASELQPRLYPYGGPQDLYHLISENVDLGIGSFSLSETYHADPVFDRPQQGLTWSIINDRSASADISVGLSDQVALGEAMEVRIDRYENPTDSAEHRYDDYTPIETNVVYANHLGMSLCYHDKMSYTFLLTIYGQTDPNTSGTQKTQFTVSGFLQWAL